MCQSETTHVTIKAVHAELHDVYIHRTTVPVSRTILINPATPLAHVARLLSAAFGWDASHLSRFHTHTPAGWNPITDTTTTLDQAIPRSGYLLWEYDLVTHWLHKLSWAPAPPPTQQAWVANGSAPQLIGCNGATPVDDCGGPKAWAQALDEIDRNTERGHEFVEWATQAAGPYWNTSDPVRAQQRIDLAQEDPDYPWPDGPDDQAADETPIYRSGHTDNLPLVKVDLL